MRRKPRLKRISSALAAISFAATALSFCPIKVYGASGGVGFARGSHGHNYIFRVNPANTKTVAGLMRNCAGIKALVVLKVDVDGSLRPLVPTTGRATADRYHIDAADMHGRCRPAAPSAINGAYGQDEESGWPPFGPGVELGFAVGFYKIVWTDDDQNECWNSRSGGGAYAEWSALPDEERAKHVLEHPGAIVTNVEVVCGRRPTIPQVAVSAAGDLNVTGEWVYRDDGSAILPETLHLESSDNGMRWNVEDMGNPDAAGVYHLHTRYAGVLNRALRVTGTVWPTESSPVPAAPLVAVPGGGPGPAPVPGAPAPAPGPPPLGPGPGPPVPGPPPLGPGPGPPVPGPPPLGPGPAPPVPGLPPLGPGPPPPVPGPPPLGPGPAPPAPGLPAPAPGLPPPVPAPPPLVPVPPLAPAPLAPGGAPPGAPVLAPPGAPVPVAPVAPDPRAMEDPDLAALARLGPLLSSTAWYEKEENLIKVWLSPGCGIKYRCVPHLTAELRKDNRRVGNFGLRWDRKTMNYEGKKPLKSTDFDEIVIMFGRFPIKVLNVIDKIDEEDPNKEDEVPLTQEGPSEHVAFYHAGGTEDYIMSLVEKGAPGRRVETQIFVDNHLERQCITSYDEEGLAYATFALQKRAGRHEVRADSYGKYGRIKSVERIVGTMAS